MVFKRAVLLAGLVVAATASPLNVRQDSTDTPSFINDDGTIDISSLSEAAAITPDFVPPPIVTTSILDLDADDIAAAVLDQATEQTGDGSGSGSGSSPEKRAITANWAGYATCGAQLPTSGPLVNSPDTVEAFQDDSRLLAASQAAKTPAGFTLKYSGLNAVFETPASNSYLGNLRLQSYSPQTCADKCVNEIDNCQSFNIYYERNPSINMGAGSRGVDLTKCNNPPSITRIGCQFFGVPITEEGATSTGQIRGNYFMTAKAGSNGYSLPLQLKEIPGTKPPVLFTGGKIANQKAVGNLAGVTMLTKSPYADPTFCYNVAVAQYPNTWQSFITWASLRAGVYNGQGCIIYTKQGFTAADANDAGQYGSVAKGEQKIWYSSAPTVYYERDDESDGAPAKRS